MTRATAEMHAYYAIRAPYYDAVYLQPERREDITFLASHLPSRLTERTVLEVACGTGYWTQHIAPSAAAPEEAPQPGPRYYHPPSKPEFQAVKMKLEDEWVPAARQLLNIERESLPVLWDCDFLLGPKTRTCFAKSTSAALRRIPNPRPRPLLKRRWLDCIQRGAVVDWPLTQCCSGNGP